MARYKGFQCMNEIVEELGMPSGIPPYRIPAGAPANVHLTAEAERLNENERQRRRAYEAWRAEGCPREIGIAYWQHEWGDWSTYEVASRLVGEDEEVRPL